MQLAINGGKSVRTKPWPVKHLYNKEKIKETLCNIIDSDNLSGYRGSFGQHFYGGKYVRKLEEYFEKYIGAKTLAVNSCTSALHIACGAIDLKPGDEVIVTPWSMTCSATAPLLYGAKPVFADISMQTFCIDPDNIENKITNKTKAIIIVDLFGHPFDYERVMKIAKKHKLYVIEDCAQALGAKYGDKYTGTLGDIGCFSFTQGKHFTCGEGGFITTKNEELYNRCALLRNHTEAVINSMPATLQDQYLNMNIQYGFNMRMTELQAAVLLEQFKNTDLEKLHKNNIEKEVANRIEVVNKLTSLIDIPGIEWQKKQQECIHSYYVLPFLFNEQEFGFKRSEFIEALKAELRLESTSMGITQKIDPLIWERYITPIYMMPVFANSYEYLNLHLKNVEDLQDNKFCFTTFQGLPLEIVDISDIIRAFYKVAENKEELRYLRKVEYF